MLTYNRRADLLYGTLLTFRTLRVGFPTAEVTVVDNASRPEARAEVARLAAGVGARFRQLEREIEHHAFVSHTVSTESGPLAIVDPDLVFWDGMEDRPSPGLVAGRLIPDFRDPFSGTLTRARLHTSLLVVPDCAALRDRILREQRRHVDFHPFRPVSLRERGGWTRWDTGAALHAALDEGESRPFDEPDLDRYDHIFTGSHLDQVLPSLAPEDRAALAEAHRLAQETDLTPLRGLWRRQEAFFRGLAP